MCKIVYFMLHSPKCKFTYLALHGFTFICWNLRANHVSIHIFNIRKDKYVLHEFVYNIYFTPHSPHLYPLELTCQSRVYSHV